MWFLLLCSLALFGKEYNHNAYGCTITYPDTWQIYESPHQPNFLCTLYPVSNRNVMINVTTGVKRKKETDFYTKPEGKIQLQQHLVDAYTRGDRHMGMTAFSLINDGTGVGFGAEFSYAQGGAFFRAYQRGYLSILHYYLVTLIAPANEFNAVRPLLNQLNFAYPKVHITTEWRER